MGSVTIGLSEIKNFSLIAVPKPKNVITMREFMPSRDAAAPQQLNGWPLNGTGIDMFPQDKKKVLIACFGQLK